MKLLFDQNLSYRLCRELADLFPGSEQATRAGLAEADDAMIRDHARRGGFAIVTHDADFAEMAALRGHPPKVIWLRCGNQPTSTITSLLRRHAASLMNFSEDPDTSCIELY